VVGFCGLSSWVVALSPEDFLHGVSRGCTWLIHWPVAMFHMTVIQALLACI